ncbi:MAG: hypothetical protein KA248_00245 [Kiritimatiellae bacterium]|nr:hypothetical protein [Kiritimatiellia bacterium]
MLLLLLVLGACLLTAFCFLIWRVVSLEKAYAWDPNSHDKMACYALDMLQQLNPKSLFGWVLDLSRKHPAETFRNAIEMQIRRGTIDEDMNSIILVEIPKFRGVNGAYHFYNPDPNNPNPKKGLSDSDWGTKLLGDISGCEVPMPSALERATFRAAKADPGWNMRGLINRNWHLDNEGRNYTILDAVLYLEWGYSHLAFYAIGRVLHLLQDMAVPAHTRNDSHSGECGDSKDPLEQYAAKEDGNYEIWDFRPARKYPSGASDIFWQAIESYGSHKKAQPAALFVELAKWSNSEFYSHSTIPGNGDSHDPNDPSRKLLRGDKRVDWKKCSPNPAALWRVLRKFGDGLEHAFRQMFPQAPAQWQHGQQLGQNILTICAGENGGIAELRKALVLIQSTYSSYIRIYFEREYDSGVWRPEDSHRAEGPLLDKGLMHRCAFFSRLYKSLDINRLLQLAESQTSVDQVIMQWVDTIPEEGILYGYNNLHGPCALSENQIQEQYLQTESTAVAYCAHMLNNWFEQAFRPGQGRGLGIWLNKYFAPSERPGIEVLRAPSNDETLKADVGAVIGVANHLPVPLPLTIEIELVKDGTDKELWENGLSLDVMTLNSTTASMGGGGSSSEASNSQVFFAPESQETLVFSQDCPKQEFQTQEVSPYNRATLTGFRVPSSGNQGGITREQEASLKKLELLPKGGGDNQFHAFLIHLKPNGQK